MHLDVGPVLLLYGYGALSMRRGVNVAPPYGKHAPPQNIAVAVALATQVGGILIRENACARGGRCMTHSGAIIFILYRRWFKTPPIVRQVNALK